MLVKDLLKKPEFKGINWSITKWEWPNDRVEMGPFTTKSEDHQREKVFIGDDRLNYIKTYGRMIYEHHQDPTEPVTILADCLGIGFDQKGQTYGIWGWYEGSETVDEKWDESQRYGQGMGYSIGGKRTEVQCFDGKCNLVNPEVLEISKTKYPANEDCMVYYINQFAKNVRKEASQGGDMFEIGRAYKRMNEKFGDRFMVDPEMDVDHALTFPCAKDYYYGMMETGLVKKSEARFLVENELNTIRKNVVNNMQEETANTLIKGMKDFSEKIEKFGQILEKYDQSPPGNSPYAGGNQALELLQEMRDELAQIRSEIGSGGSPGGEPPQEQPMEKEPQTEGDAEPKQLDPPAEESEPEPQEEESEDDEEEGEGGKKVKKAEYHSEEPEGENPETEDTNVPTETESLDMPEGENPEPEGPNPETVDEPVNDLGDASDGTSVVPDEADATDEPNASTEIPPETKAPEDMAKNLIKNKEENSLKKRLEEKGIVMIQKDNRPTAHPSDQPGELLNEPEKVDQMTKSKKGIFDMMYESGGDITIPK